MPISSLIVRIKKNKTQEIAQIINNFNEASVSDIHDENIVVITETNKQSEDKELWMKIENVPGVLQCDLIYHNFEDEKGFDHGK